MRAARYHEFNGPIHIETVPDPTPAPGGVVIDVRATGICRSDWHGWQGHDPDITRLPHIPGHELAGEIVAVGGGVTGWTPGDRVTVPFSMGCGTCRECVSGNQQVCDNYAQPGFTHWGSFAEFVALPYANVNLVRLPDALSFVDVASLGCRFVTAYRAVMMQGRAGPGDWVAVHGCGGVGLSAIMIAAAAGANVIAVDINPDALELAETAGAVHMLNAADLTDDDLLVAIHDLTGGGAHVSIDALGSRQTCFNSVLSLRKRGRHVQVGLLVGDDANPPLPMGAVIGKELEIYGSHGIQAHAYPPLLDLVARGKLNPGLLVQQHVRLAQVPQVLQAMTDFQTTGITIVDDFS